MISTSPIQAIAASLSRPRTCRSCKNSPIAGRILSPISSRRFTTPPSNATPSSSSKRSRPTLRFIPLSLIFLPPILWYLSQDSSSSTLNPATYTDHPVSTTRKISEQHKEVTIPLTGASLAPFRKDSQPAVLTPPALGTEKGEDRAKGKEVTVYHVMVKSPDLMIERPYTPVHDVGADGEVKLVVKRVRGGEVGRVVHMLKPGDPIGLRGPIPTFSIDPTAYDRVVMISSGTGIAPFLQLLSTLPPNLSSPKFDLVHASPPPDRTDWVSDPNHLPRLSAKHEKNLSIHRYPSNTLPVGEISSIIKQIKGERIMVLVCLPPAMMRPICGPLTITLQQGELTGHLRDLGLRADQVIKLE